jgi:hypothetical protein
VTESDLICGLEHTFPGVPHPITQWSSGCSSLTTIWDFYVEVAFTKIARVPGETVGEVLYTFRFKPARGRKVILLKGRTENLEDFLAFLQGVKEYLYGIAAAIEQACDPLPSPPSGPEANLF